MELRGDNYQATVLTDHELILSGARDTGKTVACCQKLHMYATVPKAQLGIVRKTQASMAGTVLRTFDRVVTGCGVRKYGGENPTRYIYPNGATVWVAGMDNASKLLSSERDAIYVNQAEELVEGDWETLGACCSGRGSVVQNTQLFGDCNPGPKNHWIRKRSEQGKLRLLRAVHKDNPDLFTLEGVMTEEGKKRLTVLEAYTGVRRLRMLLGEWASAEGAVYEFSAQGYQVDDGGKQRQVGPHVLERDPKDVKRWFLAIDEGYTNPAVILLVGEDADGRWHIFREFYERGRLQAAVVAVVRAWNSEKLCELAAVDESAAGLIADLIDAGVNAKPGKGRVLDGIQRIQNRLACAADGRPRLTVDPGCVETINEFESYVWKPESKGALKDEPVKLNDHVMDAVRYLADVLGEPLGSWSEASLKQSSVGGATPGLPAPRLFEPRRFVPRQWPGR